MSLFYDLNIWQARIHIGRWTDRARWQEAMTVKARQWLRHTPEVRVAGRQGSKTVNLWQVGGLLLGLDDEDARIFLDSRPDCLELVGEPVETAFLAYALKTRNSLPAAAEARLKAVFSDYTTVPYRKGSPDIRYVDTIGLLCPFLYSCGLDDLADRQIAQYDQALYDGVFPFHAFDTGRNLPMGVCDWGRGTGWYILGLLASDHQRDRILRLAGRMLDLQRPDGSFGSFLFNPSSPKESSATVLAGHLFVRAYEMTEDTGFLEAAQRCLRALMTMTRRDGAVDYAHGDTIGIGFYATHFDILPFAQGLTLLLSRKISIL